MTWMQHCAVDRARGRRVIAPTRVDVGGKRGSEWSGGGVRCKSERVVRSRSRAPRGCSLGTLGPDVRGTEWRASRPLRVFQGRNTSAVPLSRQFMLRRFAALPCLVSSGAGPDSAPPWENRSLPGPALRSLTLSAASASHPRALKHPAGNAPDAPHVATRRTSLTA